MDLKASLLLVTGDSVLANEICFLFFFYLAASGESSSYCERASVFFLSGEQRVPLMPVSSCPRTGSEAWGRMMEMVTQPVMLLGCLVNTSWCPIS